MSYWATDSEGKSKMESIPARDILFDIIGIYSAARLLIIYMLYLPAMTMRLVCWKPADTIGVRQSRWTRLVSGLHKAWTPNPVCQFGARRINYHTKPLLFNQIVIALPYLEMRCWTDLPGNSFMEGKWSLSGISIPQIFKVKQVFWLFLFMEEEQQL